MKLQTTPTPTPMTTTTTVTLGSHKTTMMPCAACKLLRRKCVMECPFAPYFHPSEPHRFAVVHKVFGASNVSKMLMDVPENHRVDVANSLVYEANARLRDPVYGCLGVISSLQHQAQALQAELHEVRTQIMRYRFQESEMTTTSTNHHLVNTQNIGANPINNDNNTSIINNVFLNTSINTTHIVPSYSLTNSSQTTTNSSDPHHTNGSPKSTMHHPNINHSKEHYWSQLHQSCR